ncbi:MAG: hypothetical protein SNJ77_02095 [Cytophagales bacterium]
MELFGKTYTYFLAIILGIGAIVYINVVDEEDETQYNQALDENKKEVFRGYLKAVNNYRFEYQLLFEDPQTGRKDTFWVEDVLKTELENFMPEPKNWYEIEYIRLPEAVLDIEKVETEETTLEKIPFTDQDVTTIKKMLEGEKVADIIFTVVSLLMISFSLFRIWWVSKKMKKEAETVQQ